MATERRFQFGMRFLLFLMILAAMVASFLSIQSKTKALRSKSEQVEAWARSFQSDDVMFRTLRAMDVDSENERLAIRSMLSHWDHLEYKGADSLWPDIGGRRLHAAVFHADSSAVADVPNTTVVVLIDGEDPVDALCYSSDAESETHSLTSAIDDSGAYVLSIYKRSPPSATSPTEVLSWTATEDGFRSISGPHAQEIWKRIIERHKGQVESPQP